MNIKLLTMLLICAFFIVCASIEVPEREAKHSRFYNNISFDEIWNASLRVLEDELGLIIRDKSKEDGYIYAKKRKTHPIGTPDMDIFIRPEDGRIKVGCSPVMASAYRGPDSLREDRKWAEIFFDSLNKNLKK